MADKSEKKKENNTLKMFLVMPYLLSQIFTWGYVLYWLAPKKPFMDPASWSFDQYWAKENFQTWLAVAQSL